MHTQKTILLGRGTREEGFVTHIDTSRLMEIIYELGSASNKLLVLVGPPRSGKTRLLQEVATAMKWPLINIGKDASERLLSMTIRQRKLKAEEIIADVLDSAGEHKLCIDNTEILFDPNLALNPLLLLQNLSRNRLLVATWTGTFENGSLAYAYPDHPEHFKQQARGFAVVSVADGNHTLYLAA